MTNEETDDEHGWANARAEGKESPVPENEKSVAGVSGAPTLTKHERVARHPNGHLVIEKLPLPSEDAIDAAFASLAKAFPYLAEHASHIDGEFNNALINLRMMVRRLLPPCADCGSHSHPTADCAYDPPSPGTTDHPDARRSSVSGAPTPATDNATAAYSKILDMIAGPAFDALNDSPEFAELSRRVYAALRVADDAKVQHVREVLADARRKVAPIVEAEANASSFAAAVPGGAGEPLPCPFDCGAKITMHDHRNVRHDSMNQICPLNDKVIPLDWWNRRSVSSAPPSELAEDFDWYDDLQVAANCCDSIARRDKEPTFGTLAQRLRELSKHDLLVGVSSAPTPPLSINEQCTSAKIHHGYSTSQCSLPIGHDGNHRDQSVREWPDASSNARIIVPSSSPSSTVTPEWLPCSRRDCVHSELVHWHIPGNDQPQFQAAPLSSETPERPT